MVSRIYIKIPLLACALSMMCISCDREPANEILYPIRLCVHAEKGSIFHSAALKWVALSEKRSKKKIRFSIFSGNELLKVAEGSQITPLRTGAADIAVLPPSELIDICPSIEVLYLPFLFPNRRSAEAVWSGAIGEKILEALEKEGVTVIGHYTGLSLQLYSRRRVVFPRDMNGLRLALPKSRPARIDSEFMDLLGVQTNYMTGRNLVPAVDNGHIDGLISTLETYNAHGLYKELKNMTMLNYSFEPLIVCASARFWNLIGEGQREVLVSAFRESADYQRARVLESECAAKKRIFDEKVSVVELIPEEIQRFREAGMKKLPEMLPKVEGSFISEAVAESIGGMRPYLYRFYDNLPSTKAIVPSYSTDDYPEEKLPVEEEGSILARRSDLFDTDERYCILCPVPSELEYEVTLPGNARLSFGMALLPEAQKRFGVGVDFAIDIIRRRETKKRRLYAKRLSSKGSQHNNRWIDDVLDIEGEEGEKARLIFSVSSGASQEYPGGLYYTAAWANPVLYEVDKDAYYRNLILISADTLRAERLHCYGNPGETSPNVDKLAKEGTLFENCIAQATWTLPSHFSMMTSLYTQQHRRDGWRSMNDQHSDERYLNVAEILRDHGYNTTAITEGGLVRPQYGFGQGFNSYIHRFPNDPRAERLVDYGQEWHIGRQWKGEEERKLQTTVLKAMEWIKRNKDRKFFLFLQTYQTHLPYFPNPYVGLYDPDYAGQITDTPNWKEQEILQEKGVFSQRDIRYMFALYDAQVKLLDDFMGVLLEGLEELSLDENTLIVFTSDHGEHLGDHGIIFDHTYPYEEVIKVPLILRCSTIVSEREEKKQHVRLIDVPPTLLDFAGVKIPDVFEGASLYPCAVSAGLAPKDEPVYFDGRSPDYHVGLRTKNRKFIYYTGSGKTELYDIIKDPGELVDLSGKMEEEVREFSGMAREYISKHSWGHFLVFPEGNFSHVVRIKLKSDGIFDDIVCFGAGVNGNELRQWKKKGEARFEIAGDQPTIVNFTMYPLDARITLDLEVDGESNPRLVFLGEERRNPKSLPCILDHSMCLSTNPFLMSEGKGCYAGYIPPRFLADNRPRGGMKTSKGRYRGLTRAEMDKGRHPLTQSEEHLKKLKALGYLQ